MKKKLFFVIGIGACAIVCFVIHKRILNTTSAPFSMNHVDNQNENIKSDVVDISLPSNSDYIPTMEERLKMSTKERIALLEKLGYIPIPSDITDLLLADKTTWWGKRLDPKEFWKGKVIWNDRIAEFEANRRGRGYPPIPYDDPRFEHHSNIDKTGDGSSVLSCK